MQRMGILSPPLYNYYSKWMFLVNRDALGGRKNPGWPGKGLGCLVKPMAYAEAGGQGGEEDAERTTPSPSRERSGGKLPEGP